MALLPGSLQVKHVLWHYFFKKYIKNSILMTNYYGLTLDKCIV
jgi:hypothetical protein